MTTDRLSDRDREVLGFAAEHRIFLPRHAAALLEVSLDSAMRRLNALHRAALLDRREVFKGEPPLFMISPRGLKAIDSVLAPPRLNRSCYEHDVGLAWLWLSARDGLFGPVDQIVSERTLRSVDARACAGEPPVAVRLGGFGAGGRERLHYPDLLLIDPHDHRIALELELTGKGRRRIEGILGGYAVDSRIDAVVYLVTNRALGRRIAAHAKRLGIESNVYVRRVELHVAVGEEAGPLRRRGLERPRRRARAVTR